jgi:hypothetical protein
MFEIRAMTNRRLVAPRRRAMRPQAIPFAPPVRRVRRRRSVRPHYALGAVGLLTTLLVAILPAHASSLTPGTVERIAPHVRATAADDANGNVVVAVYLDETEGRDLPSSPPPVGTEYAPSAWGAPPMIGWYRLAAAEQGVSADLLRALHEVESNAAPDGCIANMEGSGATGPFQFKRATFRQYGIDANHDGDRDICAFTDALFSAARYLRALDVGDLDDPQTRRALARYGTDPDRVLVLARSYRDRAGQAQ